MLEFQQLFAKERPKPRFTSKIFVNFLISYVFKPNSPNFLPKSAGFLRKFFFFPILHKNDQKLMCKNAIKSKNFGGVRKMLEF